MPRRHAVLALVVAVCWAVNFVVIDIGLESFPPLLFAALRFGLIAFPAIFFVPRPDVRWLAVVAVGLFICVGQFGLLFVAMNTGLPAGLASVIAPLQPVFTIPLAAVALGERPSLRQVAGVSLAVAGIGAIAAGRAHGVPLQAVALGIASAAAIPKAELAAQIRRGARRWCCRARRGRPVGCRGSQQQAGRSQAAHLRADGGDACRPHPG
jgi:O-acetylserine/cysteine efflux transporter